MSNFLSVLAGNKLTTAFVAFSTLLLVGALLLINIEPSVPLRSPPDAETVKAAAEALEQVRTVRAEKNGTGQIMLDNRMLEGLSALATDLVEPKRLQVKAVSQSLTSNVSIPVMDQLWINASAHIVGRHHGFPEVHISVGRISLPSFVSVWLISLGDNWLSARGADLPPLQSMIRGIAVGDNFVIADVRLPRQEGIVHGLMSARDADLDRRLVNKIYCRLSEFYRDQAAPSLTDYVRLAFQNAPSNQAEAYNKAALVALGYFVAGEDAEKVLGEQQPARGCVAIAPLVSLHGRSDLAKHWVVSAALSALWGDQTASMLGEWKELSDSRPFGSGFSFADLAADRSGMHYARRAVDPATASRTAIELKRITEERLFPSALRSAPEGLEQPQFEEQFGATDTARYREVVQRIDNELRRGQ